MCNAYNHTVLCNCGFGGEGHLGRSFAGRFSIPSDHHEVRECGEGDFCRPTSCPKCHARVFFVRHNGGSVWFNELGFPWLKHECFSDDSFAQSLRSRLVTLHSSKPRTQFAVVVKAWATIPGKRCRLELKCSDGTVSHREFEAAIAIESIVDRLVLVVQVEGGAFHIEFGKMSLVSLPEWKSILELAKEPDFPWNAQYGRVLLNGSVGLVTEFVEGGRKFRFRDDATWQEKLYMTEFFVKKSTQVVN